MTQKYAFKLMVKHFGSDYRKCLEWLSIIQGRLPMIVGLCGDAQINRIHSIEWWNDNTYIHTYHFIGPQILSYNSQTWNLPEKKIHTNKTNDTIQTNVNTTVSKIKYCA